MSLDILTLSEPLVNLMKLNHMFFNVPLGGILQCGNCCSPTWGQKWDDHLFGDSFANLIRMVWHQEMSIIPLRQDDTALTGHYFITHSPTGHQFDYRRKDSASTHLKPSDIQESVIRDAKILHLSGISLAISTPRPIPV